MSQTEVEVPAVVAAYIEQIRANAGSVDMKELHDASQAWIRAVMEQINHFAPFSPTRVLNSHVEPVIRAIDSRSSKDIGARIAAAGDLVTVLTVRRVVLERARLSLGPTVIKLVETEPNMKLYLQLMVDDGEDEDLLSRSHELDSGKGLVRLMAIAHNAGLIEVMPEWRFPPTFTTAEIVCELIEYGIF